MKFSIIETMVGVFIAGLVIVILYAAVREMNFDYAQCQPTEQYRERHSAAYTTFIQVNNVMIPQNHPAKDWTQRLYKCPDGQRRDRFDKWRNEMRPLR